MAALTRHGKLIKFSSMQASKQLQVISAGYKSGKNLKTAVYTKIGPKIESSAKSLASKGFLRSQKPYQPPKDVGTKLDGIFKRTVGTTNGHEVLSDVKKRFALFTACSQELQHNIPNSLLHTMETLDDVKKFYETPVDTKTPLDRLKFEELPKNLHVQYEYHRFHPDTDTKFGGVTAFPESSTLVTGLKYKDKYKGHTQKIKNIHL